MEFTLGTNKFKIYHAHVDNVVACSFLDGAGWSWFLVENDEKAMRGDETVTELLNRFLTKLNTKLNNLFGEVDVPDGFDTPLEELNYRIANDISFDGSQLHLN